MRALIADADDERRAALQAELERHGHEIHSSSVEEAPRRAQEVDALLVCLGGEGALEACRALADRIVVLVGEISPVEGIAAGASDVWRVSDDLDTRIEFAQHFARLQAENVRVGGESALLRQALDLTGTGFVLTDPRLEDHPIVYVNQSFLEMTRYPAEEGLGRNCRLLQGGETAPAPGHH